MVSNFFEPKLVVERVGPVSARGVDRTELRAAERALSQKIRNRFQNAGLVSSATHSEGWVVMLVADQGVVDGVGVDLEWVRPRQNQKRLVQVARRLFHPNEQKRLTLERFYRSWCAREALGKTLGIGLSSDFTRIDFSRLVADPSQAARFEWKGRVFTVALYDVTLLSSSIRGVLALCFEEAPKTARLIGRVTGELPFECLSAV